MASFEERLSKLEVYADESRDDIEVRLRSVEGACKDINVQDRFKTIEDAVSQIPSDLITNWEDVKEKMVAWHKGEKDRKEAVQAIWKKMGEVTEEVRKLENNIDTASNTGDLDKD